MNSGTKGKDMELKVLTLDCCGMKDIRAMNEPRFTAPKFFKQLVERVSSYQQPNMGYMKYAGFSHFMLSGAIVKGVKAGRTSEKLVRRRFVLLENYIKKHELGTLVLTEAADSPTYGGKHLIIAGLYTPNQKNLVQWGRERGYIRKQWRGVWRSGTWG
jgi:hypothetical protein